MHMHAKHPVCGAAPPAAVAQEVHLRRAGNADGDVKVIAPVTLSSFLEASLTAQLALSSRPAAARRGAGGGGRAGSRQQGRGQQQQQQQQQETQQETQQDVEQQQQQQEGEAAGGSDRAQAGEQQRST
jgi:hypothetical protein